MSRINNRDYIFLVWKDYNTRQKYTIGELSKNGKYEFKYRNEDVVKAIENGFAPLIAFPNLNEIYESYDVFPAFASRLPDRRRKDIKEILSKYKLEKYDVFELLKKSGGKLPTDSLEFIDPIFLNDSNIEREFYVAGVKHHDYCNGKDKNVDFKVEINENLILKKDFDNQYDKFAVKIMNKESKILGFIPVFFSKEVNEAIESNRRIKCFVINKECDKICEECIKVKLIID